MAAEVVELCQLVAGRTDAEAARADALLRQEVSGLVTGVVPLAGYRRPLLVPGRVAGRPGGARTAEAHQENGDAQRHPPCGGTRHRVCWRREVERPVRHTHTHTHTHTHKYTHIHTNTHTDDGEMLRQIQTERGRGAIETVMEGKQDGKLICSKELLRKLESGMFLTKST